MMALFGKAKKVYREEGGVGLAKKGIHFGYDHLVRPSLPVQTVLYNGVSVQASHWGDSVMPWHETDIPEYEDALIRGIRDHAEKGDTVVIVGGGWGVSTVVAARQVGNTGHVITFEGSLDAVENIENTTNLNGVIDTVSIQHSVVAEAISLRGAENGAKIVAPDELPDCDILVLDCEGAERNILEEMDIRPSSIVVETHRIFGAPEVQIREQAEKLQYTIVEKSIAEKRLRSVCEENGIHVLTAKRFTTDPS